MQVECEEPEGKIVREVLPLQKTPENLWGLFDKLRDVPNFLSGKAELQSLHASFLFDPATRLFSIDDVGAVLAMYDHMNRSAHVHVTFWDKRLRGREGLCRRIALELMWSFGTQWLYTKIPLESKVVRAFAKRVGFVEMQDEQTFVITAGRIIGQ